MNRRKPLIGVTGIIGSGKSSVAQYFGKLGCAVFDADVAAKKITDDAKIARMIREEFGDEVFDEGGKLIRNQLAAIVFKNSSRLEKLNRIIHPEVRKRMWEFVEDTQNDPRYKMIIVDAPLIYETDLHHYLDFIVVVFASEATCIHRVRQRSGLKRGEILNRMAKQISISEKIRRADFLIENEGDFDELKSEADQVFQQISSNWSHDTHA